MSSFSALEASKRSILAQKFGFDVVNNNINNVNTPGYSRRSAVLAESSPMIKTYNGFLGTGSVANSLRTYREELFDRDVRNAVGREASYNAEQSIFQRLEALLAEPSENGIGEATNRLFASFEKASLNPQDLNLRTNILENAKTFVNTLQNTAGMLADARKDLYRDTQANIDKVNQLLAKVGDLNKKIGVSKAEVGIEAQSYVDERENALEELAKLIGANVVQDERGQVNVFIDGINVVTGPYHSKLSLQENVNNVTGEITLVINKTEPTGLANGTVTPISGTLSAQMKGYNVTFDPLDSSGEYSLYTKLNEFVNTVATKINGFTTAGYGLNDTGATPPGRNFFLPAVGAVTAQNIQLNPALSANPADLPLANVAGEPGNNQIARSIARLANDNSFLNSMTPSQSFASIMGKIGMMSSESLNGSQTMKLVVQQVQSRRESLIGVNIDEEAVNLIKYQKAFEASSRVVNTTNEMLQTLINLGR